MCSNFAYKKVSSNISMIGKMHSRNAIPDHKSAVYTANTTTNTQPSTPAPTQPSNPQPAQPSTPAPTQPSNPQPAQPSTPTTVVPSDTGDDKFNGNFICNPSSSEGIDIIVNDVMQNIINNE